MCPWIGCVNGTRLVGRYDIQNYKRASPVRSERSRQHDETAVKQIIDKAGMFIPELLFANSL